MKIVFLSYDRNLELEKDHQIYYTDIKDLEKRGWDTVIDEIASFNPDYIIEREYDDGKALYMPLLHRVKEKLPEVIRAKWFLNTPAADKIHMLYVQSIDVAFFAQSRITEKYKKLMGEKNVFYLPYSAIESDRLEELLTMLKERKQI